jgi:AraC-like DNA-binding protein
MASQPVFAPVQASGLPPGFHRELLRTLDLRVLAVQRSVVGQWWNYRHVISPFSRLWLILGGRAVVRHHGRKFVLRPGRLHLVPPFTEHDCACARRLDHYHLHFVARLPTGVDLLSLLDCPLELPASPEAVRHFRRLETLFPDRKLPCYDPAREEYRRFALAAEQAERNSPPVDTFEAHGRLSLLLAPFLRDAHEHAGPHASVTRQFLAVQQFIHERMQNPLRLGDLARVSGLNPTYFSDRFRELVGVRPLEYLMRCRMERAQYLLLTSGAPVKQVAAEVGIPDAAYFTRVFTHHCGCSPSRYRAAHLG